MAFALWSDLCAIEKTCVVREAFLQAVVQNTKHITKNVFVTAVMTPGYANASTVN